MEQKQFEEKNVCYYCHIAFDKSTENCPICNRKVKHDTTIPHHEVHEGEGRMREVGGEACDYCPFCYGNADWCPLLD